MLISELCQNHQGSSHLLFRMVEESARAGARFAKIQSFFADDLTDAWRPKDYERLKKLEITWALHGEFVRVCEANRITPMTSVYTKRYMQQIWDSGFRWVKIGSAQASDQDIILSYMAAGFHVVVSTGGHDLSSLPHVGPLAGVLHCISQYPSTPWQANLARMLEIKKWWPNQPYGLSDHTDPVSEDWDLPARVASALGSTFIEKHFTMLPRSETRDGPVSINFDQLFSLCQFDGLSLKEKIEREPRVGLVIHPQTEKEKDLIEKYQTRWMK